MNYDMLEDSTCIIGESPICVEGKVLVWVDAESSHIYQFDLHSKQTQCFHIGLPVTAIAKIRESGWLLVTKIGIYACDPNFQRYEYLGNPVNNNPKLRPNDGVVSPVGDLWFGTMNQDELEAPDGALFILHKETMQIQQLDCGFSVANGIAFDVKNHCAYVSNMFQRKVYRYQLDSRWKTIQSKRVFVELPQGTGLPDGLKVDSEGKLYVCHWDAGIITVYESDGQYVQSIPLPIRHTTRCTFIDNGVLALTTASYNMTEQELQRQPLSGTTLRIDLDADVSGTDFEFEAQMSP
ncbi:cag pathogenicity island protein Cag25 [Vibrio sp. vnigr-6D03]|uniref:SMP-30/gluconolactonase/LRE family protein n=1 Tax=Vibrio sp. vnigr-6D03 TaxID=2058088 RepID=UPI000C329EB8|nr:SMP-30/gluconolactonase/LRE family protein [Vibrio sp. vnigr-6D03]PKF80092.1 cag pathogenicity island protein Cag25 [Vibrio sp. vnigr-6D03]